MADILPFRAFHYSSDRIKSLSKLVCPPYDVISAEEHKRLLKTHAENFVKVELPSGSPSTKYDNAAKIWKQWLGKGVLSQDAEPAFYIYEVSFRSPRTGKKLVRQGFFAALRVVPWGRGVHPHEKTLPTHKADRLKLFKALGVQPSSIQVLFDDPGRKAAALLKKFSSRKPWVDYSDLSGVRHRLWRASDPREIDVFQSAVKRSEVVIADGHHRYETSRTFGAWARQKWGKGSPASNYVMTYFNPVDDPGLEILPTHRAVGWDKRRFVRLEKWGNLIPVKGLSDLQPLIDGKVSRNALEVGVYRRGNYYRYRMNRVPASLRGSALGRLAVGCFHAGALDGLGKEDFFFTRNPREAVRVADETGGWAFFLAPTDLRQVMSVSTSGRVMPPKSTYFYPKIPSGLVSRSLRGEL